MNREGIQLYTAHTVESHTEYVKLDDHLKALEALREAAKDAMRHIRHDSEPGNLVAAEVITKLRAALKGAAE